jgi:predicted acylesterase/phospholipase RssA
MDAALRSARFCSFASAGTRGVLYIGMLEAFEDHLGADYEAWRSALRGAAGTSAGACAALLLLLGLDREARRATLREFADVRSVVRRPDIALLFSRYGCEDGAAFKEVVQKVLERGGLSAQSTLGDLRRLLRQDFVCVCTDLRTGAPLALSAATAPGMRVCDALYASCAVPFLFSPAHLPEGVAPGAVGATVAVDGCLSCDLPEVFEEAHTLFVALDTTDETMPPIASWADFLHGIVRCSSVAQQHRVARLVGSGRCLRLPLPMAGTPAFDVHQGPEQSDRLFDFGYALTRDALGGGGLAAAAGRAVAQAARLLAALTRVACEAPPPPAAGDACDPGSS